MNLWKWLEFFEDDNGRLSTTNLSFMICVIAVTFVVIYTTINDKISEGILWVYVSVSTAGLVTKKGFDSITKRRGKNDK